MKVFADEGALALATLNTDQIVRVKDRGDQTKPNGGLYRVFDSQQTPNDVAIAAGKYASPHSVNTLATLITGTGSPEGVVYGEIGWLYTRVDGGVGTTLYVKETGSGFTGWVAK